MPAVQCSDFKIVCCIRCCSRTQKLHRLSDRCWCQHKCVVHKHHKHIATYWCSKSCLGYNQLIPCPFPTSMKTYHFHIHMIYGANYLGMSCIAKVHTAHLPYQHNCLNFICFVPHFFKYVLIYNI